MRARLSVAFSDYVSWYDRLRKLPLGPHSEACFEQLYSQGSWIVCKMLTDVLSSFNPRRVLPWYDARQGSIAKGLHCKRGYIFYGKASRRKRGVAKVPSCTNLMYDQKMYDLG